MGVQALRRVAPRGGLGAAREPGAALPRDPGLAPLPSARLNGTEIAYDTAGAGPAVVLVHAGAGDRGLWDGVTPALAERHLVVRPDLRGFGGSPLPAGPFSHVEDVRALLDHLGVEQAAVVGNSFGGRIALDLALAHPERVAALVLVAAAASGFEPSPELEAFDDEEEALLDAGRIDDAVELNLRTWLDGPLREIAPVPAAERERVAAMLRRSFETIVAAYAEPEEPGPVSWPQPPALERLDEVRMPTLVVSCAHDVEDFRTLAATLAAGIPGARLETMDTAHLPSVERPDELARLLLELLGDG